MVLAGRTVDVEKALDLLRGRSECLVVSAVRDSSWLYCLIWQGLWAHCWAARNDRSSIDDMEADAISASLFFFFCSSSYRPFSLSFFPFTSLVASDRWVEVRELVFDR